jgi:hypothetical protein
MYRYQWNKTYLNSYKVKYNDDIIDKSNMSTKNHCQGNLLNKLMNVALNVIYRFKTL